MDKIESQKKLRRAAEIAKKAGKFRTYEAILKVDTLMCEEGQSIGICHSTLDERGILQNAGENSTDTQV